MEFYFILLVFSSSSQYVRLYKAFLALSLDKNGLWSVLTLF